MHIKITPDDVVDLLSALGVAMRKATLENLLDIVETTNFTEEFLLAVATEETNLDRASIMLALQQEYKDAVSKGETVQ